MSSTMSSNRNNQKQMIISIEGNIGSGKSTLLAHLKNNFQYNSTPTSSRTSTLAIIRNFISLFCNEDTTIHTTAFKKEEGEESNYDTPLPKVVFLREPVDEWEAIKDAKGTTMLQKFYTDQERYSFSFQMMAFISRLALLKEAMRENPNAIIITERSLFTDRDVFAKMLYESGKIEDVNYQIYMKWFDTFTNECPIHKVIYVCADPEVCHERIKLRARLGENVIPLDYLKQCHLYHEKMINEQLLEKTLILDGNIDIYQNIEQLSTWQSEIESFIL